MKFLAPNFFAILISIDISMKIHQFVGPKEIWILFVTKLKPESFAFYFMQIASFDTSRPTQFPFFVIVLLLNGKNCQAMHEH